MIVTIKFIAGQEIDLDVEADYTISSIKELVARQFNVPADQQRLVFKVGNETCQFMTRLETVFFDGRTYRLTYWLK